MSPFTSPAVAIHLSVALAALVLGPVALGARKGSRLHRAAGYTWVTLMLLAAGSSVFIRDFRLPNIGGYTPIHLLTVLTFAGIARAMWAVLNGRIALHKAVMWSTYLGGCVGAGSFALMPNRYLGNLVWNDWLGLGLGQAAAAAGRAPVAVPLWVWPLGLAIVLLIGAAVVAQGRRSALR